MWDYMKRFLGLHFPDYAYEFRSENGSDQRIQDWELNHDDLSDDEGDILPNQHFFSVFTSPIEMHKFFERQMEDIVKRAFQFNQEIGLDVVEESSQPTVSLRDEILKPGITDRLAKDDDLDGRIGTSEIQSFLDQPRLHNRQQPSVYSHSVIVKTVRRPDGTVQTTRTERDHTGEEKTTITTQTGNNQSENLQVTLSDVFSKLISF